MTAEGPPPAGQAPGGGVGLAEDAATARRRFRRTAGRFATGVTVVTTHADGQPHGTTVNSFTTVSMDPFMVMVSLGRGSRLHDRILDSWTFCVSVLAADQEADATWFADRSRPSGAEAFADRPWRAAPRSGAPILLDGVAYFDCTVADARPAGDHTLLLGRVESFAVLSDRPALVFADSRFVPQAAHQEEHP
ncbi:flavin reductase family protein [Streptomyces sp. NPDC003038]|uniref:flavin reductase family protein n=1 Tax=unclassified Streptomyces TaxID=2593676 RepID=UPI0033BD690D